MNRSQRSCCRKEEGAAAQAELLFTRENLLVHAGIGDAGQGLVFEASEIKPS